MTRVVLTLLAAGFLVIHPAAVIAQHPNVTLHLGRWRSSAIQLDSSLTQDAWHQFTEEMGVVSHFRPLADARPLGRGTFEISIVLSQTGIDETAGAWNDTYVHPNSTHWLTDGGSLGIPGLLARAGVSNRIDVGAYFTNNLSSNYGMSGLQVQYNALHDRQRQLAASARLGFVVLFGPHDVDHTVYEFDLLASKGYMVGWASVSPYLAASSVLSTSHENSDNVDLKDEDIFGVIGTIGVVAQMDVMRLAVEYSLAQVNSLAFKVGAVF